MHHIPCPYCFHSFFLMAACNQIFFVNHVQNHFSTCKSKIIDCETILLDNFFKFGEDILTDLKHDGTKFKLVKSKKIQGTPFQICRNSFEVHFWFTFLFYRTFVIFLGNENKFVYKTIAIGIIIISCSDRGHKENHFTLVCLFSYRKGCLALNATIRAALL